MLEIRRPDEARVELVGRFDAAQEPAALETFEQIEGDSEVDFSQLKYISSAGLGVLFATQARLRKSGHELVLTNLSPHIREIFRMAGFDKIFTIR